MGFGFINILSLVLLVNVKSRLVLSSICEKYSCNCIVNEIISTIEFANCSLIEKNEAFSKELNKSINGSIKTFNILVIEAISNRTLPREVFKDHKIGILMVVNLDIEILDPNVFDGVKMVKLLELSKNRLVNIDFNRFSSSFTDNLETINLNNNLMVEIPNLSQLKSLENIYLSSNRIQRLTNLDYLINLKRLDLSSNLINAIDFGVFSSQSQHKSNQEANLTTAFKGFPNLEYLSLAENNLLNVQSNSFYDFPKLAILDLSQNQIASLPRNALSGLLSLKELRLQRNELTDLDENVFDDLCSLKMLDLSHNKLTHFKVKWLARVSKLITLDLSNNQIEMLEFSQSAVVLQALKFIDLSRNKLKNVGELVDIAPKLSEIYLSDNFLSRIPTNLMRVQKLDLTNQSGYLKEIGENIFLRSRSGPTLLQLDLKNNSDLAFTLPKSLCFKDPKESSSQLSHYLDITISETALKGLNKCALKQLNRFFRRVRVYVVKEQDRSMASIHNHTVCLCDVRIFLARFNILVKHNCPLFRTYCANQLRFIDDCSLDEC